MVASTFKFIEAKYNIENDKYHQKCFILELK